MEPDSELRARLLYVAGDSSQRGQRIMVASGAELEHIADEFGLKRRKVETQPRITSLW